MSAQRMCDRAPKGWVCTRYHGHLGPCAPWPLPRLGFHPFQVCAVLFAVAAVAFDVINQAIVDVVVLALVAVVLALLDVADRLS
jgi:hypothetical protein